MKVAYFTPLNPLKSGISDFSEEIIPELSKYIDLDIFIDGYKPVNKYIADNFNILDMKEFDKEHIRQKYDIFVYQMGNNEECHERIGEYCIKYPGVLELHDISLHHMLAATTFGKGNKEAYINEMSYCHGEYGKQIATQFISGIIPAPWETQSLKFNVNKRYIDNSKAVIVHSDFAKQMVKAISKVPVETILHHTADIEEVSEKAKTEIRKSLKISEDKFMIASFGFATYPKRIIPILHALSKLKKVDPNFTYYIVGQASKELDLQNVIKELDLQDNVVTTGFVDLDNFKNYMRACDICLNLRYPTQGESSGSMHRALGLGKVIFVSKIGSFNEYPDDVVIKISTGENEIGEIYTNLASLISSKQRMKQIQNNAINFSKENCSLKQNAKRYSSFLENICKNIYYEEDVIENLVDKFHELEIYEKDFISEVCGRLEDILV